jgi:hypothetical protein
MCGDVAEHLQQETANTHILSAHPKQPSAELPLHHVLHMVNLADITTLYTFYMQRYALLLLLLLRCSSTVNDRRATAAMHRSCTHTIAALLHSSRATPSVQTS